MGIVNTKNSRHYLWGNKSEGWHLLESEELSVIEEQVPPSEKERRHFHQHAQQFFYVLSGVAQISVNDMVHEILPGNGIHVPAGVPHQLVNKGRDNLRFLVVSQPKSHGDRIDVE